MTPSPELPGEETHADASSEKAQGETKKRGSDGGQHF